MAGKDFYHACMNGNPYLLQASVRMHASEMKRSGIEPLRFIPTHTGFYGERRNPGAINIPRPKARHPHVIPSFHWNGFIEKAMKSEVDKMAKKRLVLALGHDALGTNLPKQKAAVEKTAKIIADFIQEGWQAAITCGNTPQLGMIHTALNEFAKEHPEYTPAPMSVCSAMSQGYIGYDLQNALRTELIRRGIYKPVSTILTQVTVDPYDESSYRPMKVIGRIMNAEEAKAEEGKGNYVVKEGDGFRRIVAAPKPVAIVEIDAIRALMDADQLVIAAAGGGIPVMEQGTHLKGASAVIEKDRAAGLLAKELDADVLMFLTGVDNVVLNYGSGNEVLLDRMTAQDAETYAADGHFKAGSMLPKVEASVDFIRAGKGRKAVITSMEKEKESLAGKAGTTIE